MMQVEQVYDVDLLRPLMELWKQETNGDLQVTTDVNYTALNVASMMQDPSARIFGLVRDDRLIGFLGCRLFRSPTGPELMAQEHYFYVAPEHRGKGTFKLLVAARDWAKARGASGLLLSASYLASDLHDKVCKLYAHMGAKPFETTMLLNLSEV